MKTCAHVLAGVATAFLVAGCSSGDAPATRADLKPLSAALAMPVCSKDGWCWQRPSPQGNDLTGMWGVSATDAWVAGDGAMLHWDGVAWTLVSTAQDERFVAFWGSATNNQWALGSSNPDGNSLRFSVRQWDGSAWTVRYQAPDGVVLEGLWGTGPRDVWVAGSVSDWSGRGATVLLHWDGSGWTDTAGGRTGSAHAIWGTGPSDVWTGGDHLPLLHWDGNAWAEAPGEPIVPMTFWGSGPNDVWAGGFGGSPLHWDGQAWSKSAGEGVYSGIRSLWGSGPADIWGLADTSTVIHWDGLSWTVAWQVDTWQAFGAIWGSAANDVWIAADAGRMAHWDGTAWTLPDRTPGLNRVAGTGPTDVWAVGASVAHWDGTAWTDRVKGLESWVSAGQLSIDDFAGVGPEDAWAVARVQTDVTTTSMVLHWDGRQWAKTSEQAGVALWAAGPSDLWMIEDLDNGSRIIRGDGATWAPLHDFAPDVFLRSLWGSGANDVWAVGTRTVANPAGGTLGLAIIVHWDGTAWSIQDESLGNDVQLAWIHGSGPSDVWAVGAGAATLHFNGTTWQQVAVPGVSGNTYLGRVYVVGPGDAWAIDQLERTGAIHWDGTTWSRVDTGSSGDLHDVYAVDGYAVVVGFRGGIVARVP